MKSHKKRKNTADMRSHSTLGKTGVTEAPEASIQDREEWPEAEEFSFPVLMQSLGANLEIVSVNRIWLEVLGYEESEVIGRKSSEFLTQASRLSDAEVALPKFLKTGSARDVAYKMLKKRGIDRRSTFSRGHARCERSVHR